MFEEFWSDLGKVLAAGVLAGSASFAMQWAAHKAARRLRQTRALSAQELRSHARVERRLAAILLADVVGYSKLMNADEEGTHAGFLSCRRDVMEPKVREHRGRIVKNTGDGALVEFGSAVDAVRCALDLQQTMMERNAGVPQSNRIDLRVGVNLGDVIVEPDDIYGHAVNIVARLESLAAPGGICISADICRHVKGRVAAEFFDMGERELKNIANPVRVFAVSPVT
jgi:adenylate cyclase